MTGCGRGGGGGGVISMDTPQYVPLNTSRAKGLVRLVVVIVEVHVAIDGTLKKKIDSRVNRVYIYVYIHM